MILALRRPCAGHRAALVDFVDRRELRPATAAALAHLDRCPACEADLSRIALAIAALRRLHREVAVAEPPADAWLRLRARIQRPVDPWRWRATVGGLVMRTLLVAVVVGPQTLVRPVAEPQGPMPPGLLGDLRAETVYLTNARAGDLPPAPRVIRDATGVPVSYPAEIREYRKEVDSTKPSGRPPEPI